MNEKGLCNGLSSNDGKFEHSFIELDDARFLEINLSVTAKDSWGDFKSKVLDKCSDIQWENSRILNLIKLTITGNNSEVKRIISSSIESKNLIRKQFFVTFRLSKLIHKNSKEKTLSQVLELLKI